MSACLLALDARNGKRIWQVQAFINDLGIMTCGRAKKLLTIVTRTKMVECRPAGKTVPVWLLTCDVTGEPIWPIEELQVPKSDVPGETVLADATVPTITAPWEGRKFKLDR